MAFDPSYATNGKFYLNFVVPGGTWSNGVTHVSQFQVSASNPDVADAASEKILLTFSHPQTNHNGGWIGFSPRAGDDHNLYIGLGDGGSAGDPQCNAQNINVLLGKMLRIDVDSTAAPGLNYALPLDNPFVGKTGRDEIWLYGLRNPFRFSFDSANGNPRVQSNGQIGTRIC